MAGWVTRRMMDTSEDLMEIVKRESWRRTCIKFSTISTLSGTTILTEIRWMVVVHASNFQNDLHRSDRIPIHILLLNQGCHLSSFRSSKSPDVLLADEVKVAELKSLVIVNRHIGAELEYRKIQKYYWVRH